MFLFWLFSVCFLFYFIFILSTFLLLSFCYPSVSPFHCFQESLAHPKSASSRGLWEPMESPWPGMQAGSHSNAGMWGVWGDKSRQPSQREEKRDAALGREGWGRLEEGETKTRRAKSLWMGIQKTQHQEQPESKTEWDWERGEGDLKGGGGGHTGDGKPALFLFAFHLHPWPYRPIGLGAKPRA